MSKHDFRKTVFSWYKNNPVLQSGSYSNSMLFRMLYNSYCSITTNKRNFDKTVQECAYSEDCAEIFAWYKKRYTDLGLSKGTRGQKRYVTGNETEERYSFDLLYCDDRQFQSYLLTDTPQSGNQDLFCFILHTAVAFLVSPKELDSVLQTLGFHPLHIRNIHHLAVYTVLSEAQPYKANLPDGYNPFDKVKNLYFEAHKLMKSEKYISAEVFSYDKKLTQQIRQQLFIGGQLSTETFKAIITNNAPAINWRHSLILDDFHRLSAVYTTILDDYPEENEQYSIYQFVNRFCTPVSIKKFREYMGSMIDNNQKHPTRQILILLWLYDYCFSFVDGIQLSDETFEKILRKLGKYNLAWVTLAKRYRKNLVFDAYGFINSGDGVKRSRLGSNQFDGSDFYTILNSKLMLRYDLGRLNKRLPFDYYILSLCSLNIASNKKIDFPEQSYEDVYESVLATPYPLQVVMDVLEQLKTVIAEESGKLDKKKSSSISPYPLDCRIYEQI